MKVSIIVPVFNEEKTIRAILAKVKKVPLPKNLAREIIVVDDGSKDNTPHLLKRIRGIKIISHKKNRGKGAAIRTALKEATDEIILIQDADLEYNPNDYPRLLTPIIRGTSKVVYGTRLKHYPVRIFGKNRTPFLTHYLGNKFLTLMANLIYGSVVTDMETGYKVFARNILDSFGLESNRFEFESELTAKILKNGFKIHEVPIKVKPRGYEEGKKITWRDGFIALWTLVKYRFID